MDHYIRDINNAVSVKKTFISTPQARSDSSDIEDKMREAHENWLKKNPNGQWIDIVSYSDFYFDRFRKIKTGNISLRNHLVYILREGSKVINFTILDISDTTSNTNKSNSKIVYFGWLPDQASDKSAIFRSSNINFV